MGKIKKANLTTFIIKKYSQMSGSKKVKLGMQLSQLVREVRKAGKQITGA